MIALLVALAAMFALALLLPHPSPQQIRDWAESVGPAFPLVFFVAHTLITVAPFPRTVLTLSAGLLFGPLLGITIAVTASTLSAAIAILLVRALDRDRVAARLTHPAVQAIDRRLERRGWLAVGSLRLIAPVPFSITNYCAGLSAVRFTPYLLATIVGVIPGTIAVVTLGDALTGSTDPALFAVSAVFVTIGLIGLVIDARAPMPAEPPTPHPVPER